MASVICEALSEGDGGTCSLVPLKYIGLFLCSLKSVFECSLFPNIVFDPLKIWPYFLCFPEIDVLFPLFTTIPANASYASD